MQLRLQVRVQVRVQVQVPLQVRPRPTHAMRSLYWRIYATVVVALLLFALVSGWLVQRHLDSERARFESVMQERFAGWVELIEGSLPAADAPVEQQVQALREWSQRLRLPLALDDARGQRLGASDSFIRRSADGARLFPFKLDDGRTLWAIRGAGLRAFPSPRESAGPGTVASGPPLPPGPPGLPGLGGGPGPRGSNNAAAPAMFWPVLPPGVPRATGLAIVLLVLFLAVALGAYPVVRRLTRRLEVLKQGVETFGEGRLGHRVAVAGNDEVAAVAASFNTAAERVEALVQSHRSLLANASHELRSPLARMKMAVSMLDDATPAQRDRLKREIDRNVAELDALVEEVLLASRLDATAVDAPPTDGIDLAAVVAEEAARVDATVEGLARFDVALAGRLRGDERLIRRAVRNLLENAQRYGGGDVVVRLSIDGSAAHVAVCDRGPGVPPGLRERIFEPFYRLPGHAEREGGVGLGLSLVRQIVSRHRGRITCSERAGGGSCFTIELPLA